MRAGRALAALLGNDAVLDEVAADAGRAAMLLDMREVFVLEVRDRRENRVGRIRLVRTEQAFATEDVSIVMPPSENHEAEIVYGRNGQQLAELIWGKLMPFIGEAKTIYFSPDGVFA